MTPNRLKYNCVAYAFISLLLNNAAGAAETKLEPVTIDSLRKDDVHFSLEHMQCAPDTKWCAGLLVSYRTTSVKRGASQGTFTDVKRIDQHAIAIELTTGRTSILRYPPNTGRRTHQIMTVEPIGTKSYYIGAWSEDDAQVGGYAWEWDPSEGTHRLLGSCLPLPELGLALEATHWSITWPHTTIADWQGEVELFRNGTKSRSVIRLRNSILFAKQLRSSIPSSLTWNGGPEGNWRQNERFHCGCDEDSVVSLITFPVDDNVPVLRSLSLNMTQGKTWEVSWGQLKSKVDGLLTNVNFIRGLSGPCRDIQLACSTLDGAVYVCSVNSQSGALSRRLKLTKQPDACMLSRDGSLLVVITDSGATDQSCVLYRMPNAEVLIERSLRDLILSVKGLVLNEDSALPFLTADFIDRSGAIVFSGENCIYLFPRPYSGDLIKCIDVETRKK